MKLACRLLGACGCVGIIQQAAQQRIFFVGDFFVDDGVQKLVQCQTELASGRQPGGHQVSAVDGEILAAETLLLRQDIRGDLLQPVVKVLTESKGRRLPGCIGPLERDEIKEYFGSEAAQHPFDGFGRRLDLPPVLSYQRHDPQCGFIIEFETAQDPAGSFRAEPVMLIKVPDPVRVFRKAIRFADVMQERGQPQMRGRRDGSDNREGMFPYIVNVMRIFLFKAFHRQQFRDNSSQDIEIGGKHRSRRSSAEQAYQFFSDAFTADGMQQFLLRG